MLKFPKISTFFLSLALSAVPVFAADASPHEVFEQFIKAWSTNADESGNYLNGTKEEHVTQMQTLNSKPDACPNPTTLHLVNEKIDGTVADVTYEAQNKAGTKVLSKAKFLKTADGWKISSITPQEAYTATPAASAASSTASTSSASKDKPSKPTPLKLQFNPASNLSPWSRQATTLAIPNTPVGGSIGKAPFKSTKAEYAIWYKGANGAYTRKNDSNQSYFDLLDLYIHRDGGKDSVIKISMPVHEITDKQTIYLPFKVRLATNQVENGVVTFENSDLKALDCAGRVFLLNKAADGKLPVYVYLRMQTAQGPAEIKGYFYATESPKPN